MNQIVVTLENGADSNLLQKMIENMKGVLRTSIRTTEQEYNGVSSDNWLDTLHSIKSEIDPTVIDMNDDRTRYLMSK